MMKGKAISTMLDTIKQWFSGPNPLTARQWIFMPDLSRKRKKRLETLPGPLLCVTPSKPKSPLPSGLQWQPLAESTTPPAGLYATARQLVDAQISAIKAYLPDFFKNPELQLDYEPAYKLNRQQNLAISGLAFLTRCFESFPAEALASADLKHAPSNALPLILDSPIAPALLDDGELARHHMPAFATIFSTVTPLHPQDFKKRRVLLKVPTFAKPTVLLVMSAPVHFELARAAVENLEKSHQVVIYFANQDKLDPALRQKLSQRYFTIDAHTLLPDERLIKGACGYFNLRLRQIANLPIPPTLREALNGELDRVSDTIHILCLLETVLGRIQPVAVMGCMEKNRMSMAFKTLQSRYNYKLLNFQHGIMPLTHNMDWLQFDRFFVWNPLTRNVILKDGYPRPESLAVVGNPFWEQSEGVNQAPRSAKAQEILAWRGDSQLIGAYTQYAGDYLTHDSRKNYLKALFAYLEARPNLKLLIKKHPLETDQLAENMLAQSHLQDRVMLCAGKSLDLWESFGLIQFSTTICSTTLLDSLKVNVPAVALDFTDIIANIGYGYDQEPGITIIRDPETVTAILDGLLEQTSQNSVQTEQPALQSSTQSLVYPDLPGTYAQRIQQSLVELGLLSATEPESTP